MFLCFNKHHNIRMYGGVNVQLHIYLISLPDGVELPSSYHTYPIHRSVGEPQSWSEYCGEDKNPKISARQKLNPDSLVIQRDLE
jgi:hypothetical protein